MYQSLKDLQAPRCRHVLANLLFAVIVIGTLTACGNNGTRTVATATPGFTPTPVQIPANLAVYISTGNSATPSVYALRARDASLLWRYKTGLEAGSHGQSLVLGTGVIFAAFSFFANNNGNLPRSTVFALRANNGSLLWRKEVQGDSQSGSPADLALAADNDAVYVAINNYPGDVPETESTVYALRAGDGKQLWCYQAGTAPVRLLVDKHVVYIVTNTYDRLMPGESIANAVSALRANDGSLLWHYQPDGESGKLILNLVVANGAFYILTTPSLTAGAPSSLSALRAGDGSLL